MWQHPGKRRLHTMKPVRRRRGAGTGKWLGWLYRCERCLRIIDQNNRQVVGVASQRYRFIWQGIEIEATYTPRDYCGVIAHLGIRSIVPKGAPLPITSTGYLSHFHRIGTIEARGGDVVAQVTAWLNEEAATNREWFAHVEASRRGDLFA